MQLLELAAITLTPKRDAEFTFDELMAEANRYGGGDVVLDPKDVRIVLPFIKFLEKRPGKKLRLK